MARKRMFFDHELPVSVVRLVSAICGDYERREREIARNGSERVRARCLAYNTVIDSALSDMEVGVRRELVSDIAAWRGYSRSGLKVVLSKNAYYRRRRKLIYDIACGLSLINGDKSHLKL